MIVVDNSGRGLARHALCRLLEPRVRILDNPCNVGFGAAVNQACRESRAPWVATLNDDAAPGPTWLEELLMAVERRPEAGMCASQVRLSGQAQLDSAGMLICADGSSKQRGHLAAPDAFDRAEVVLLPSASAALYRRSMLDEVGGFDERFFLYCEDTDLGLRARWAGWQCVYVPSAVVEHHYSHSVGQASPLKAYYVERNRLFVLVKNFPLRLLLAAPVVSLARYAWHLVYLVGGRGSAAHYRGQGHGAWSLVWTVVRAHVALVGHAPYLWRDRRRIRRAARISTADFRRLLRVHSIPARQVARL